MIVSSGMYIEGTGYDRSSGMYIEGTGYGRVFRYVYRRYWLYIEGTRVFRYVYRRYWL